MVSSGTSTRTGAPLVMLVTMTKTSAWGIRAILSLVCAAAFAAEQPMERDFTEDLFHGGT